VTQQSSKHPACHTPFTRLASNQTEVPDKGWVGGQAKGFAAHKYAQVKRNKDSWPIACHMSNEMTRGCLWRRIAPLAQTVGPEIQSAAVQQSLWWWWPTPGVWVRGTPT
jgi:hypothetical protein